MAIPAAGKDIRLINFDRIVFYMVGKELPFTRDQVEGIVKNHPTPFHIYDERGIRESARKLIKAFSWVSETSASGFRNYFAVKANPNPHILRILKEEGMGVDCSSLPELVLAERTGFAGENIMFTSNDTPAGEYKKARELGAIINLDDISHIPFLEEHGSIPEVICFRYNPGPSSPVGGSKEIGGKPEEVKYGFTREQLSEGFRMMKGKGVKRFGIHTMLASNILDPDFFVRIAEMMFDLVLEVSKEVGIDFEFVNLGGGIGIPYRPGERNLDLDRVSRGVRKAYEEKILGNGLRLKIFMENGRFVTGPNGYLVSRVLHKKEIYKNYAGLDACMADLMRPGIYGAYHHITVLGKENRPSNRTYDVTGSLCENMDKFAIDRKLPEIDVGDILVIHDTGAHGHSMGFNYNGKLRSAELLMKEDGKVELIRRAETIDDYFSTLRFPKS